jgi:hypothetical protein
MRQVPSQLRVFHRPAILLCAALLPLLGSGLIHAQECVGFLERVADPSGTNGAMSVQAVDMDGDGDTDLLSASFNDELISWYENDGETPPGYTQHVISDETSGASSVYAADLDGDGDPDVLSASAYDNKIAWYENLNTSPTTFLPRTVSLRASYAFSVHAADLDDDGDVDILAAAYAGGEILWYENILEDGMFASEFDEHVISADAPGASAVWSGDIDADGIPDVLSASNLGDKISWYKIEPGVEVDDDGEEIPIWVYTEHVISETAEGAMSVAAADLDSDGDLDVLSASAHGDEVAWYENSGTSPVTFVEHTIATHAEGARSVQTGDLDNDGDIDVFAAAERINSLLWYENRFQDSGGTLVSFVPHVASADVESIDAVVPALVNDDAFLDLAVVASVPGIASVNDRLSWFENDGGSPLALTERPVSGTSQGVRSLVAADLDDDGDPDLIWAGGRDTIAWSDHQGGTEPVFVRRVISNDAMESQGVYVVDLDGDDDLDVISASAADDKIAWYESDGAVPPSFVERVISLQADEAQTVFAADVDGDGHLDVLSASIGDDKVAWYESDGASPPAFTERELNPADAEADPFEFEDPYTVHAADLNDDGHTDVITGSWDSGKIAWYQNNGEDPPAFTEYAITSDDPDEAVFSARGVRWVDSADMDGDGDTDLLSASSLDNRIAWYENDVHSEDETLRVFLQHTVTTIASSARFVIAVDIDEDDDNDMITVSAGSDSIFWYENDGEAPPVFVAHFVGRTAANPTQAAAADLNADDKTDIVGGYRFQLAWYEQMGEVCGLFDATGDGQMDGAELAWLTRAFGNPVEDQDPMWWDGVDFNQDGIVDGTDLAILSSIGVWGRTTETCAYTCW